MKIRKLLLSGALLLGLMALPLRARAEEPEAQRYKSVTITTTDGKLYGFNLVGEMEGFFNDNADFEIHYPKLDENGQHAKDPETGMPLWETVVAIPGYQIESLELNAEASGVEAVPALEFNISYDVNTSLLTIAGAKDKEITVFSADGRMEYAGKCNGETVVEMGRFGAGVHIVKIDSKTFKLLVK